MMDEPSTSLTMDTSQLGEDQKQMDMAPHLGLSMGGPPSTSWTNALTQCLDVSLSHALQPPSLNASSTICSTKSKKLAHREDTTWGAWFFFTHYLRPCFTEKAQGKLSWDGMYLNTVEKGDLKEGSFVVQYDLENCYMWVMKLRPENALGKMQLRSYMNGHTKFGEPQFPFSVERGFVRSHRLQRKQYKGLSNPQCLHGLEILRKPINTKVPEADKQRWFDLTGREFGFMLPSEAEEYVEWRNMNGIEAEIDCDINDDTTTEMSPTTLPENSMHKKKKSSSLCLEKGMEGNSGGVAFGGMSRKRRFGSESDAEDCSIGVVGFNGSLGLGMQGMCQEFGELLIPQQDSDDHTISQHRLWMSQFSGVMTQVSGPVTASKTIYEDDLGYLIIVSLPYIDMTRLRVTWLNAETFGIVKIHGTSITPMPLISRWDRTFKLTDSCAEHCPPGDFVREIILPTRIPENAAVTAVMSENGNGVEILVPKQPAFSEEREVRVYLPHKVPSEIL